MMSSIQMSYRMASILFPISYYQTMYFIYVDRKALRIEWLTMVCQCVIPLFTQQILAYPLYIASQNDKERTIFQSIEFKGEIPLFFTLLVMI